MSTRLKYANEASVLADFVIDQGGEDRAINLIATRVADGGSVKKLCEEYGLNWGVLWAWIRKDDKRNGLYSGAMIARGEWRREALLDGWWDTAAKVPEENVTHGDVHKARDALAKAEGMYKVDDSGNKLGGGGGMPDKITIVFVDSHEGRPAERVING